MTHVSASHFAHVADQSEPLWAGYFEKAVREAAIARAYLRPEMVVADVGTGVGFMAAGLASLVKQVYAVYGSAVEMEISQHNLIGFDNVTCKLADGTILPFEDGSLDAVFVGTGLHDRTDPCAAIVEMVRVLRPGGRLVILAPVPEDEVAGAGVADGRPGFDRAQVKSWLRQAGLVNVIVDRTSRSNRADSQTSTSGVTGEISAILATGSRRVSGAREAVQADYGALAESAGCGCGSPTPAAQSSCCSPSNAMELVEAGQPEVVLYDTGYTAAQLAAVPVEAANLSLGCGNPTAMASLRTGEVVLDIGSGAGLDAFYAARRVGPQGQVFGLDMTPAMIERARRSAQEAGLTNVEFRLGQAEAMPIEDGIVDVILSNCVINLAEDKGQVFEEAYRVLKDGGRLSISDMVTVGPLPMSLRSDPQMWAGCINGALPEREYLDLVEQAGFADVVGTRTLSGGELAGVQVYSLSVTARKGPAVRGGTAISERILG